MIPILYSPSMITEGSVPTHFGIGSLTDCIDYKVTEDRNGKYELNLAYPANGIHADQIQYGSFIKVKPNFTDDPQLFQVIKVGKTMSGQFSIYCQHISYLLSGKVISSGTAGSATAACLLLTGSAGGFTITTDKNVAADFTVTEPSSVRSWFGGKKGSLLDIYGTAEWHYDNFTCSLLAHRGADRGVQLRYGKNLTQLSQEINMENLCTGIIPFCIAEDGTKTVGTKVSTGLTLDFPRDKAVDFTDDVDFASATPVATQLATLASNYISNNNFTDVFNSITLDFVQLSNLQERVDLCDTVHIFFEALGITATLKCVSCTWDGLAERYTACTFGDMRTNIADTIVTQEKEIKDKPSTTSMNSAISRATEAITGNLGGYVVIHDANGDGEPDEILIMDTPDISTAVKVWRWNASGLAYSDQGYDPAEFTLAITANGEIVADFITTGTLTANLIKAGVLSDVNGNSTIDMTTGKAKLYQLDAIRNFNVTQNDVVYGYLSMLIDNGITLRLLDTSGTNTTFAVNSQYDACMLYLRKNGADTITLDGDNGVVKPTGSQWVEVYTGTLTSGYTYFDYDPYNTIIIMAKVTSTSSFNAIVIPKCMLIENTDQKFCISDEAHYVVVRVRWFTQNDHNYITVTFDSRDSSGSVQKIYASYT